MVSPIVYTERAGQAPVQVPASAVPLSARLHAWLVEQGYRAVWVMVDQGAINDPPQPSCYGGVPE